MPDKEAVIKHKHFYRILEISSIFVGVIMALYYFYPVFASPPGSMYAPGETTDPTCSPGDANCSVYPPLATTLSTSTAITMATHTLRFAYSSSSYTALTVAADGALTVSSTGGVTTTFVNKISVLSNAYFATIASGTWNGSIIGIAYGGTNSSTIAANGSIIYSDGSKYNASAVGAAGQILQSNGAGVPTWINTNTMGFVNLQGATSGTQQIGNLNISGVGLFGSKIGINTTTPAYALVVSGTTYTADLITKGPIVDVRAYGADETGQADSTNAFRTAVAVAARGLSSSVGGSVYIPSGQYKITGTVTTTDSRVNIFGDGKHASMIVFNPGADGTALFAFATSSGVLYQQSIKKIGIVGQGAFQKIGIKAIDTSEFTVEDVAIASMNGNSSVGIQLKGREMTTLNRISVSADKPLVISDNPNSTIDVDHLHVQDAILVASSTNPNVTIDSGVNLTNTTFDGYQAWVLGGYGLRWVDTSASAASANLSLNNVRWEQSTYVDGYIIDIEHNYVLQNLSMKNIYGGLSTNGIKLRNINWASLDNYMYVDTAKTAMDVNTSVLPFVLKDAFFQAGSTSTFGGLTTIMDSGRDTIGGTTYSLAVYDNPSATGVSSFNRLTIGTTTLNANPFSVVSSSSTGSTLLTVLTNGNVGIGVTAPQGKLNIISANSIAGGSNDFLFTNDASGNYRNGIANIQSSGSAANNRMVFRVGNSTVSGQVDVLSLNGDGHAGIGTTTPQARLTIQGAGTENPFSIVTSTAGASSMFTVLTNGNIGVNTSSPIATLALQGVGGTNPFEIASSTGASLFRILQNGNVGINSSSPIDTLGVQGGLQVVGGVTSTNLYVSNLANIVKLGVNTSSPIATFALQGTNGTDPFSVNSSTGAALLNVLATGKVGIGLGTPRDLLEISNSAILGVAAIQFSAGNDSTVSSFSSGRIASGHTSGAYSGGYIDLQYPTNANTFTTGLRLKNGRIGMGTTTPQAKLTIQGAGTEDPFSIVTSTAGASSMFTVLTNGNIGVNTSSPIATLALQGVGGTNPFEIASSTGASLFRILQNGNVGIGTSTPTLGVGTGLHVSGAPGTIRLESTASGGMTYEFRSELTGVSNAGFTLWDITNGLSVLSIDSNGKIGFNSSTPLSMLAIKSKAGVNPLNITSSTNASMLSILTNGYVGIGIDNPLFQLHVVGTAYFSTGFQTGDGSASAPSISYGSDPNTGFFRFAPHGLGFTNGGTESMRVNALGQMGLNSSTPTAQLSVQGFATSSPLIDFASSSGSSFLRILANGNVGINTSSPNAKFAVWGAGTATPTFTLNTFSSSGTSTFKIDDAGNAYFANDGLYYEASSSVSYVNSMETGALSFDDNAGFVSWVDMAVSSSVAGTSNAYTASINGNPMIQVYADSDGLGGVANMTVSVGTSTTSTYKMYIDAGASTTAGLGVNGFVKASGFITASATLDIAETYPVDPECEANGNCPQTGDVVCSAEDASSTFFIEQCSATSTDSIIGVVSENPGFILGGYDFTDVKIKGLYPTSFRPVALGGRVPVNVSTANGPIKAGDYLTSSAIPGIAVKALEPGKVIGMALQSFDGSVAAIGTVSVFVHTSWSLGSPSYQEGAGGVAEADVMPDFAQVILDKFTLAVKNSLRKLGLLIKDGVASVKQLFADKVTTQQLCVGQTCINEQQLQDLLHKTQTQAAAPVIPPFSPQSVDGAQQEGAGGVAGDQTANIIQSPPDSVVTTTTPIVIPAEN